MVENLSIVVGSDNPTTLPVVLNGLKDIDNYEHVSASRISDLMRITKLVRPTLIILNYKNNQLAINNLCTSLDESRIPILCLTCKNENESFHWDRKHIVFTLPMKYAKMQNYLSARVNSILLLLPPKPVDRNKNLSRYVLELDQKISTMKRIKDSLKQLYPVVDDSVRNRLITIVNWIKMSTEDKKHWDDFKMYFENINPEYVEQLSEKYPSLTTKDIKYCCYLKMNMSNEDIRHILGISLESVRTHKYRLKKKMELPKDQNLQSFARSFNLRKA